MINVFSKLSAQLEKHRESFRDSQLALLRQQANDTITIEYSLGIVAITVDGLPIFRVVDKPTTNDELSVSQAQKKVQELRENYIQLHNG